ncbi:MAG: TAXI family TRAP transporter solute-binding subunit [Candidatus Rokuibacteriota bacterium]
MKKLLALALVAGAIGLPLTAGSASRISVGTGSTGGVYYFVGTAMSKILNQHLAGVTATPEPVTGSAHATKLVHAGELTIALAELATVHHGYRGSRKDFDKKYDGVRFLMAGMDTGQTAVVWASANLKSYGDIKGKRIATNSPASLAMLAPAMAMYDVKASDVQHKTLNYSEQVSAMKDGALDVGFFAAAPRNASVMELAATRPVRVLGLDAEKAREFGKRYPYWTPLTLTAGTYAGQDADVLMPAFYTTLIANKDADPTLVYNIVKAIIEHGREFGELHAGGKEFTADKTRFFVEHEMVPVPFHPGAERFWRERGVLK